MSQEIKSPSNDDDGSANETDSKEVPPLFKKCVKIKKADNEERRRRDLKAVGAWRYIMEKCFKGEDDPTSSEIMQGLYRIEASVYAYLTLADLIRSSGTYDLIDEEQTRLENRGYDEDEASKAAWFNRRFRIVKFLVAVGVNTPEKNQEQEEEDEESDYSQP